MNQFIDRPQPLAHDLLVLEHPGRHCTLGLRVALVPSTLRLNEEEGFFTRGMRRYIAFSPSSSRVLFLPRILTFTPVLFLLHDRSGELSFSMEISSERTRLVEHIFLVSRLWTLSLSVSWIFSRRTIFAGYYYSFLRTYRPIRSFCFHRCRSFNPSFSLAWLRCYIQFPCLSCLYCISWTRP